MQRAGVQSRARGELVGERLVVNKAAGAGRMDSLFVKAHRVAISAFQWSRALARLPWALGEELGAHVEARKFENLDAGFAPLPRAGAARPRQNLSGECFFGGAGSEIRLSPYFSLHPLY
jgi:hypothetical protein